MPRTRLTGYVLILTGITVPQAIGAYETANALDIPRDFGVLPWLIMAVTGVWLVLRSFLTKEK